MATKHVQTLLRVKFRPISGPLISTLIGLMKKIKLMEKCRGVLEEEKIQMWAILLQYFSICSDSPCRIFQMGRVSPLPVVTGIREMRFFMNFSKTYPKRPVIILGNKIGKCWVETKAMK